MKDDKMKLYAGAALFFMWGALVICGKADANNFVSYLQYGITALFGYHLMAWQPQGGNQTTAIDTPAPPLPQPAAPPAPKEGL